MKSKTSAFTLIELLTVIAIIAILMGLLFPIMGMVKNTAYKATARNDMTGIKGAVNGYFSDYGSYPLTKNQADAAKTEYGSYDTMYGDEGGLYPNDLLFNILRAREPSLPLMNPKKVIYIEGKPAKNQTTANPTGGFADNATGTARGRFYDPWGNQYVVWVDSNGSGYIDLFNFYGDPEFTPNPNHTANIGSEGGNSCTPGSSAAASIGKDGKFGKNGNCISKGSDDVLSWQ